MKTNRRRFLKLAAVTAASVPMFAAERQYKACVIGHTGRGNYGHFLDVVFQKIPNVTVMAVADPNEKGRAEAAKRIGVTKTYADFRDMLETERPNLVSIAPRFLERRREMIEAAAAVGAHVFLEKPMAPDLEEADAMVAALERKNLNLNLANQGRLSPAIVHLKKLVDDGFIGELLEIRARGKEDRRAGGEDLMVLGWHCLYLMRYFAGQAIWCSARVTQDGRDIARADARAGTEPVGAVAGDTIHATYAFKNGVQGHFASQKARAGRGADFGLTLFGSKGVVRIHMGGEPEIFHLADPLWSPGKTNAQWKPLPDAPKHADASGLTGQPADNKRLVEDLLRAIETGSKPVASAQEGRAVLEMIMGVYAAALSGGRAQFPLKDRKHPLGTL